jgi:hypothetical protein
VVLVSTQTAGRSFFLSKYLLKILSLVSKTLPNESFPIQNSFSSPVGQIAVVELEMESPGQRMSACIFVAWNVSPMTTQED